MNVDHWHQGRNVHREWLHRLTLGMLVHNKPWNLSHHFQLHKHHWIWHILAIGHHCHNFGYNGSILPKWHDKDQLKITKRVSFFMLLCASVFFFWKIWEKCISLRNIFFPTTEIVSSIYLRIKISLKIGIRFGLWVTSVMK